MITALFSALAPYVQAANELTDSAFAQAGVDLKESREAQAAVVVASLVFFLGGYFLEGAMQPELHGWHEKHRWAIRVVSQYNAVFVSLCGWIVLFDAEHWADPVNHVSSVSALGTCVIMGYMIHDTITVIRNYEEEGFQFLAHGILTFVGYAVPLYTGKFHAFTSACLMFEFSTIPLNARMYMVLGRRTEGALAGPVFLMVQLSFLIWFLFCRIALGFLGGAVLWAHMLVSVYATGAWSAPYSSPADAFSGAAYRAFIGDGVVGKAISSPSASFSNFSGPSAPAPWWAVAYLTLVMAFLNGLNVFWSYGLILMALGMDKKSIKRRKAKAEEAAAAAAAAKKIDNPAASSTGRMTRSKAKAKAAAAAATVADGDGTTTEKKESAKKLKGEVFITFLNLLPYAPFHYLLTPCEPARGKEKAL